jgi:hypothetical protein
MRTSTYLRVATITVAALLAACDANAPTSPSRQLSAKPTSQANGGCTKVEGTIVPFGFAILWPGDDIATFTGSLQGTGIGSMNLVESDATHNKWEGSYSFSDEDANGLQMHAVVDIRKNTGTPSLDVQQVTGTMTVVEGISAYKHTIGTIEVTGMTGEFLNDPKSRSALKYHGALCSTLSSI